MYKVYVILQMKKTPVRYKRSLHRGERRWL